MTNPTGYFEKVLAVDCETTGLAYNCETPYYNPNTDERFQAISWGIIVADAHTFEPIDELYVEIQWDPSTIWTTGAERVHGLSKEYLAENGLPEEDAVVAIAELIMKHWGVDNSIQTLGHNVATFDLPFLRSLLLKYELPFKFGNRHLDSHSLGFGTLGTYTSNELFSQLGFDRSEVHNALEDARCSLNSFKNIKMLFDAIL